MRRACMAAHPHSGQHPGTARQTGWPPAGHLAPLARASILQPMLLLVLLQASAAAA